MNEPLTSHLFMAPYLHHGLPVTALPIRQLHFFFFFLFCSVVLDSHVVITLSVCSLVGGACVDL